MYDLLKFSPKDTLVSYNLVLTSNAMQIFFLHSVSFHEKISKV